MRVRPCALTYSNNCPARESYSYSFCRCGDWGRKNKPCSKLHRYKGIEFQKIASWSKAHLRLWASTLTSYVAMLLSVRWNNNSSRLKRMQWGLLMLVKCLEELLARSMSSINVSRTQNKQNKTRYGFVCFQSLCSLCDSLLPQKEAVNWIHTKKPEQDLGLQGILKCGLVRKHTRSHTHT